MNLQDNQKENEMMTKQNTPQEILALIEVAKEEKVREEAQAKLVEQLDEDNARNEKEKELLALFEKVSHLIPDVLIPYFAVRDALGNYNLKWWQKALEFHIPGLAPIAMIFHVPNKDNEQYEVDSWLVAGVIDYDWDDEFDVCAQATFSFHRERSHYAQADHVNIRKVLYVAQKAFEDRDIRQAELELNIALRRSRRQKEMEKAEHQKEEETALFDAIKNDPIAIHMLKAFVLLRDERSAFEQHISEMDEAMYGIENSWSRKAADLRRQAEDIERRAQEEKHRLQSDLDDAEAKLKKAERGW